MKQSSGPLSVIVADDHPLVLHGLVELLHCECDISVLASCKDGKTALESILSLKPDVAVLDIAMPGLSGLEVLKSLAADRCESKVIFLTASATGGQIKTAIAQGAKGFLLKETALEGLVECIRDVAAGHSWFPTELMDTALLGDPESERLDQSLTSREREVMLLVSEGLSNKEVGRRLSLSEGTVKIHLHNIFHKLGVVNRTALAAIVLGRK